MENEIKSTDGYVDKLKKTVPGDLTAIYISFRVIVANAYEFDFTQDNQNLNIANILNYVSYITSFMLALSFISILYLYFISGIRNYLQIVVIIISYILWMISLDIGIISFALSDQLQLSTGLRFMDLVLRDKITFIGITMLWTLSIPIIYKIGENLGVVK